MVSSNSVVIAVDGMGGDRAPQTIIEGMLQAYNETQDSELKFILFIPSQYKDLVKSVEAFTTTHYVEDVVDPHANPLRLLKTGLTTTMGRAIQSVQDGEANAIFSCGTTGAYIALCWKILKLLPSIQKIALPACVPSSQGRNILMDVGASPVVTDRELTQFAIMGNAMARVLFNKERPKVGLMNIGTEEIKGLPHTLGAHKALKNMKSMDYFGFVEPPQIFGNDVDVIVTDGYAGNIAVKSIKGSEIFFNTLLKNYLTRNFFSKILSLGALYGVKKLKKSVDWRQYNGAPLLGFSKLAVKGHGDSDTIAVAAALKLTYMFVKKELVEKIQKDIASNEDILISES